MNRLCDIELCTGCGVCALICPNQCIKMEADLEGFLRPNIDKQRCTDCNLCGQRCPILNLCEIETDTVAYAAINKNEEERFFSTSGGVFSLLCKWTIERQGVVFGAAYDESFNVVHCKIENLDDVAKLRGAKYAQSNLGDSFEYVRTYLEEDRYVLFSGTPCQIAGLASFLGKDYDKLLLVDLICHGVPSPMIWREYIKYRNSADAINNSILNINLRSKISGWPGYSIKFDYDNGASYTAKNVDDPFLTGFVGNLYLRPSCYDCKYKGINRISDFTLGDYWGVWDQEPEFNDGKGTSLIFLHSNKARKCWVEISACMKYKEVDARKSLEGNPSAIVSSSKTDKREVFFSRYENEDFDCLIRELSPRPQIKKKGIIYYFKWYVRNIVKMVINRK